MEGKGSAFKYAAPPLGKIPISSLPPSLSLSISLSCCCRCAIGSALSSGDHEVPKQKERTLGPLHRNSVYSRTSKEDLDRFIPNRSAMDFDYAHYMLNGGQVGKENDGVVSPSQEAYQKKLIEIFNMNRGRILAFKRKPATLNSIDVFARDSLSPKPKGSLCQISKSAVRVLDAPGLLDNYYTNVLVWVDRNIIAIGLGTTVYLWDASTTATSELVTVDEEDGPITSLSWASNGCNLAVALSNSQVQIWNAEAVKLLMTLRGCHRAQVGSLAWNDHIIKTGGMDGLGRQLASGGNDNLLCIWDKRSMESPSSDWSSHPWIYRFQEHSSAVRALAWCPFQSNLLASGGGLTDRCIKFWNTNTGSMLKSLDTGSQVCTLLWNRNEPELLSSHGFEKNELLLLKYPSMQKMAELEGHMSRVLHMAQSPDGCMVVTAGDETLRFWNIFGSLEEASPAQKATPKPFSAYHISIR